MRIAIVGASGNVGTALLRRLAAEPDVDEVVGVARRPPGEDAGAPYDRATWLACDIGEPDAVATLTDAFRGADAVVHLGWQIQPSHDRARLRRTNVTGSGHVARAVVAAGVPALVYASSVGTYAPAPKDMFVDETWPATGIPGSDYSQDKAAVETMLDEVERDQPGLRLVRLRPALIFQRDAGAAITRYFVGPLVPVTLLRPHRLRLVPRAPGLRVQCVHADDIADAYLRAVLGDVRGAFNVAADPVLSPELIAERFGGRTVPAPTGLLRGAARASWLARLQPTEPGWVTMAENAPLMDCTRIASELGWRPASDAVAALRDLLDGIGAGAGTASPALRPSDPLRRRVRHLLGAKPSGHGTRY
ncbi:MAG TPA: NAD-dependent epimerase/dehydratase family protein [Cryptosporangiaceae bacterium]|nr:NAD-dependent epimerase/dehydratase family protein [Cryptosporangiaceae bacterium]